MEYGGGEQSNRGRGETLTCSSQFLAKRAGAPVPGREGNPRCERGPLTDGLKLHILRQPFA
jgi:hypothetical protein